MIFADVTI